MAYYTENNYLLSDIEKEEIKEFIFKYFEVINYNGNSYYGVHQGIGKVEKYLINFFIAKNYNHLIQLFIGIDPLDKKTHYFKGTYKLHDDVRKYIEYSIKEKLGIIIGSPKLSHEQMILSINRNSVIDNILTDLKNEKY